MLRLILAASLMGVAACGAAAQPVEPVPPSSSTPDPPAPATSTSQATPVFAELAEDPCRALSAEDAEQLSVVTDGMETPVPSGTSCQWLARGGLVSFTAFPTADKTRDHNVQQLSVSKIEGHRALLGRFLRGRDASYTILVAMDPGQSFRILAVDLGPGTPGPDALTVARNFAAAIIRRLR